MIDLTRITCDKNVSLVEDVISKIGTVRSTQKGI